MSRIMRNTAAVLAVTLFIGIGVFMTVQLAARVAGPTGAGTQAAQAATPAQESVDDGSAYGYDEDSWEDSSSAQGSEGYGYGYGSPQDQGTTPQDSGGGTLTCPRTGCSASSCHALQ